MEPGRAFDWESSRLGHNGRDVVLQMRQTSAVPGRFQQKSETDYTQTNIEVKEEGNEQPKGKSDEHPFDRQVPKRYDPISTAYKASVSPWLHPYRTLVSGCNLLDRRCEGFRYWQVLNVRGFDVTGAVRRSREDQNTRQRVRAAYPWDSHVNEAGVEDYSCRKSIIHEEFPEPKSC